MKATLVMPFHDPEGLVQPHLMRALPDLRALFAASYITITPETDRRLPRWVANLEGDPFWRLTYTKPGDSVGAQFRALYSAAAHGCDPDSPLHLAFPDRLAYALLGPHRDAYVSDVRAIRSEDAPQLFQRSALAWSTHPPSYREMEGLLTRVGQLLLGRELDFAWCYLVVTAAELARVISGVRGDHMEVLAEILLPLAEGVVSKEVDWLSWEDPLITGRDAEELLRERDNNVEDVRKRLAYVAPMLQVLVDWDSD